jgi:hypothetical protein
VDDGIEIVTDAEMVKKFEYVLENNFSIYSLGFGRFSSEGQLSRSQTDAHSHDAHIYQLWKKKIIKKRSKS